MQFEIVTPEKIVFQEEVDEVIVPTTTGEIAVLPHHMNLLTQVIPGEVTIKIKSKEQYMAVTGGFLEMKHNKLTLLADYAIRAEDINAERAIAAQKRAEEVLKRSREEISERDFALAQGELRQAILELKVSKKRR